MNEWPNEWVRVPCPNGHEIQSYDDIHEGDVSGICDVCGAAYRYRFPYDRYKGINAGIALEVNPIPPEPYDIDLPPFPTD